LGRAGRDEPGLLSLARTCRLGCCGWERLSVKLPSMRALLSILSVVFVAALAGTESVRPGFLRPGSTHTDLRTWTSNEGRQLLAELVAADETEVVLVAENGTEITVPLSRLSEADREYVAAWHRYRASGIGFYEAGIFSRDGLPERAHVDGVEHVAQRPSYSAAASAEILLKHYQFDYDQRSLADITSVSSRRGHGTEVRSLAVALKNVGLDVAVLRPNSLNPEETPFGNLLNGMKRALSEGKPVAMTYRPTTGTASTVVVVGYDDRRRSLYILAPGGGASPERILYKIYEDLVLEVLVPFPSSRPAATGAAPDREFLRRVSGIIRERDSLRIYGTTLRLRREGISAEMRDVNRLDARSSQGATRSFARQHGVTFVQQALDRGQVVLAQQSFESGEGLILIYGHEGNSFAAVEYFEDGTFRHGQTSFLDFSLRWMTKRENLNLLYLVEITPPGS